jgi:hypothetical protein
VAVNDARRRAVNQPGRGRSRLVWTVFVLACAGYVMLGLAEQGMRIASMPTAPSSPLPFARHEVFGLDLRDLTSLEALDWLNSAGREPFALVILPLDADVVLALGEPEQQNDALFAMDRIVEAAAGSPLAVCLQRPADIDNPEDIAESAVGTLTERYPNAITYVSACDYDDNPEWQEDVAGTTLTATIFAAPIANSMMPLSTGEPVRMVSVGDSSDISAKELVSIGSDGYTLVSAPINEPVGADLTLRATDAIRENPQVALIAVRPGRELDPSTVADSLRPAIVEGPFLPSGYSSVAAPGVGLNGDWQDTLVGTVPYRRATTSGPVLFADFIGTDVSLLTILSPDAGRINAWVDPNEGDSNTPPDVTLNLIADQATDVALPLFTDLPGARHRVIIQAEATEGHAVAVSGLFVSATTAPVETRALAAVALLITAAAALAERSLASISAIREGYPSRALRHRHTIGNPRGFSFRR